MNPTETDPAAPADAPADAPPDVRADAPAAAHAAAPPAAPDTTDPWAAWQLAGRTVLVTGASSGLGQACALACSQAGARVLATGRDAARLDATVALLADGHAVVADLRAPDDIARLVDAVAAHDPLDGVVHAAGIDGVSPWRQVRPELVENVWRTNFAAPFLLTRALLARRLVRAGGSLLFISSVAALAGKAGVGPYSASKAAMLGGLRPLALEVARQRIRANALCPGIVDTPIFDGAREWLLDEVAPTYPLGLGTPADIGWTSVFFLSDASRFITGTAFSIDGGVPFL